LDTPPSKACFVAASDTVTVTVKGEGAVR